MISSQTQNLAKYLHTVIAVPKMAQKVFLKLQLKKKNEVTSIQTVNSIQTEAQYTNCEIISVYNDNSNRVLMKVSQNNNN